MSTNTAKPAFFFGWYVVGVSLFIALVAVSFVLTTLDSATRLLRYNIQEVSETLACRS